MILREQLLLSFSMFKILLETSRRPGKVKEKIPGLPEENEKDE